MTKIQAKGLMKMFDKDSAMESVTLEDETIWTPAKLLNVINGKGAIK